jgi:hypothetical protein
MIIKKVQIEETTKQTGYSFHMVNFCFSTFEKYKILVITVITITTQIHFIIHTNIQKTHMQNKQFPGRI